jgi:hypothetical protein
LIVLSRDHSVHSRMSSIRVKPSRRELLFNLSMLLWEDKRNSITDGSALSIMTSSISAAKLLPYYSSTAKNLFLLLLNLF